jgi:hypothetical protein
MTTCKYNFATQTKFFAVTQWDTAFNSFAKIGGKVYGASSSGLYEISRSYTDDDGTDIDGYFRTGWFDFGVFNQKKIRHLEIHLQSTDDLKVTAETENGNHSKLYRLPSRRSDIRISLKEHFPSTLKGSHFRFKIQNMNGGWFRIYNLRGILYTLGTKPSGGGGIPT